MILALAFIAGAGAGWRSSVRRGGDKLDRLHYAAVHGLLATILTLVAIVIGQRAGFF